MTYPETIISDPLKPSTRIDFTKEFEIDGCPYSVRVNTMPYVSDAVTVDLVGIGPDGETTDGRFTVHISALPHLGRVLTTTFTALAALHGAARSSRRERGGGQRRGKPDNSHRPWTGDLEAQLAQAWQAATPAQSPVQVAAALAQALEVPVGEVQRQFKQSAAIRQPEQIIAAIAALMQRTPVAITSRLEKLGLNPSRPGVPTGQSTPLSTAPAGHGGHTRIAPESVQGPKRTTSRS